jgi:hypothetical protein
VDLNDDGSYDGPMDLVGGMDGFKGSLTLRYAVASSNDDGTQIEVVPVNATTGTTNGWMVGLASVDNIGVGLSPKFIYSKLADVPVGNEQRRGIRTV